jgi:Leucine-rich repeat (LRR) protein
VRLQVLSVRNNALIALPSEVTKLTSLQELDLYSNKIAKLPSSLGKYVAHAHAHARAHAHTQRAWCS